MPFDTFPPAYPPVNVELVDRIVSTLKSQGIFDQFRKDCLADVDTKPAYQNLQQRVNGTVAGFLATQTWQQNLNKTQLRESLRRHVQQGFLEVGVDRIVDQVVNPKIFPVFMPKVEDVVYNCLGLERPKKPVLPFHQINPSFVPIHLPPPLPIIPNPPMQTSVANLLPKDLDPVSPESNHHSLGSETPAKDEQNNNEPSPKYNENDNSQLSGISELSSHVGDSIMDNIANSNSINSISSPKPNSIDMQYDNFSNLTEKIKQAEISHGHVGTSQIPENVEDIKPETIPIPDDINEPSKPYMKTEHNDAKLENVSSNSLSYFEDSKTFVTNKFLKEDSCSRSSDDSVSSSCNNKIKHSNTAKLLHDLESSNYTEKDEKNSLLNEVSFNKNCKEETDIKGKLDTKTVELNKDSKKTDDKDKKSRDSSTSSSKYSKSNDTKHRQSDSKHRSSNDRKEDKDRRDDSKSSKDRYHKDDKDRSSKDDKDRSSKDDKDRSRHKDDKSKDRYRDKEKHREGTNKKDKTELKDNTEKKQDKSSNKHDRDKDKSSRSKHDRDKEKHEKDKHDKEKQDKDKDRKDRDRSDRDKSKHDKEKDREKHEKDKTKSSSEDKNKDSKKHERSSHAASSKKVDKSYDKDKHSKSSESNSKYKHNGEKSKADDERKDRKRKSERCNDDVKSKETRRSSDRDSSGGKGGSSHRITENSENRSSAGHESSKSSSDRKTKSSTSDAPSDQAQEYEQVDGLTEVDLIISKLSSSIEEVENMENELERERIPNEVIIKKPKIAKNIFEIRKVMQARKTIDRKYREDLTKNRKECPVLTLENEGSSISETVNEGIELKIPEENKENIKTPTIDSTKLSRNSKSKKFYGFNQTEIEKSIKNYRQTYSYIERSGYTYKSIVHDKMDVSSFGLNEVEFFDNNLNNLKPMIRAFENCIGEDVMSSDEKLYESLAKRYISLKNVTEPKECPERINESNAIKSPEEDEQPTVPTRSKSRKRKYSRTNNRETDKMKRAVNKQVPLRGVCRQDEVSTHVDEDGISRLEAQSTEKLTSKSTEVQQAATISPESPTPSTTASYLDDSFISEDGNDRLSVSMTEAILDNLMKESNLLNDADEYAGSEEDSGCEWYGINKSSSPSPNKFSLISSNEKENILNDGHQCLISSILPNGLESVDRGNSSTEVTDCGLELTDMSATPSSSSDITSLNSSNEKENRVRRTSIPNQRYKQYITDHQNSRRQSTGKRQPQGSSVKLSAQTKRLSRSSQRYDSTDLYKPRPVLPQNSKRIRTSRTATMREASKKKDLCDSPVRKRAR